MGKALNILVVEDDRSAGSALARLLQADGYRAIAVESTEDAAKLLHSDIDLVLSDLRLGSGSGMELLKLWHAEHPYVPFILMTAYGEISAAVNAMKLGADDFLTKPIHADELLQLIRKCLGPKVTDSDTSIQEQPTETGFSRLIGRSKPMRIVFDRILRAAKSESTVLILGESGTGKELVAQSLHENSPRNNGPFIAVNMAAVPESLVESELFGHVKGSFTGAIGNRVGKMQAAQGGTIFIDEIGDFALASQAKLLRVLETRKITPVGGDSERAIDVRVVAATSRKLEEMVADGQFREDLYYRLSVVALPLPPLRDRRDDIPLLLDHFLSQLCKDNNRARVTLDPELVHFMESFDWPGNVRQLRNCLESMVVMSDKVVLTMADLPPNLRADRKYPGTLPAATTIEVIEKAAILKALEQSNGNRTRAAEHLGISVRTLQRRLQSWGINSTP